MNEPIYATRGFTHWEVRAISRFCWFLWGMIFGLWLPKIILSAIAADTLPIVSPPTDWTGVFVVMGFTALLFIAAVIGYVIHVRKTPGKQLGESEIEWIAESLFQKQQYKGAVITTTDPMFYDGITFANENEMAKYKEYKAYVDAFKGGAK